MSQQRSLTPLGCVERPWLMIDGKRFIDFSSNDYLGLRFDERIKRAYIDGIDCYGVGSGGSPLVCGYDEVKRNFEQQFASFVGMDKALFLTSGYTANLSVFSVLFAKEKTEFFLDKSCHASIYDALKLRGQTFTRLLRYTHQDLNALERMLKQSKAPRKVIVSEGIFSMTGQQSCIKSLLRLKRRYQASLVIDDAHCIGVKGIRGRGSASYVSPGDIDIIICPLGKAFAMQGAMIAASESMIDELMQKARPYVYSTAPASAQVLALMKTLELISNADKERVHLEFLIAYFNQKKQATTFKFIESTSAIQFVVFGDLSLVITLHEHFKHMGIYCYPIRQPTVTYRKTGLRIVLSSKHTSGQIDDFFNALGQYQL